MTDAEAFLPNRVAVSNDALFNLNLRATEEGPIELVSRPQTNQVLTPRTQ